MYALQNFEHQLVMYVTSDDKGVFTSAFDLSKVPTVSHEQALAEERTKKLTTATPMLKAPSADSKKANGAADGAAAAAAASKKYAEQLDQIPELKAYGPALKSSTPVELTESETEYVVSAVKHVFKEHIVIQYDIKNTLDSVVLEEISVVATPEDDEALEEEFIIPLTKLSPTGTGSVYVAFKKVAGEDSLPVSTISNNLKFTSKEIDPSTGEPDDAGYEDEYQVEDLDLTGSDYVIPAFAGSFDTVWEEVGESGEEASETLQLDNVKGIAGMFDPTLILLDNIDNSLRCNGTTHWCSVTSTPRRHRCHPLNKHAHPQTLRQHHRWRQGRLAYQDGFLRQDGSDDEDYG